MIRDVPSEELLRKLLKQFSYKPDWTFNVQGGLLLISILAPNTDNPKEIISVCFSHGIPQFVYHEFPWTRWLLDQIMEVERHEAQEFFKINGVKVFDPHG